MEIFAGLGAASSTPWQLCRVSKRGALIFGLPNNCRVFHILDEREPFSDYKGGALSRWVGNILKGDSSSSVICKSSDSSWKVQESQVRVPPGYELLAQVTEKVRLPVELRSFLAGLILKSALTDLSSGDSVWIHNRPEFCFALSRYVRSRGARLVLHLQNSILEWKRDKILRSLRLDRVVFASEYLRDATTAKFATLGPSSVIYNGSDDTLFRPGPQKRKDPNAPLSIAFASRLVHEKGAHVLVDAVLRLNQRGIPVSLKIIGSTGFGKTSTSEYIVGLQRAAPSNVEFLGYRSSAEIAELLRNADVFCLPAVWDDPFPLAPLEAMASGVAVVATRSGGIPEAFKWGGAILVAKGSADELAAAFAKLAAEPETLKRLSEEGLDSFRQRFTWPHIVRRFRDVANSV